VTAVTEVLALFWQGSSVKREVAMEKMLMFLAFRFALFVAPVVVMYLVR
jgi:hypothetical protein